MNENYWIKLYQRITEHDVFHDSEAYKLFTYILTHVDWRTGKMTTGRFVMSEILRLKPTTFYKVLKRLEKKYDLVTLSSNNRSTEISVKNWAKYQSVNNLVTQDSNNKVTTKGQQSNTIYRITEYRDTDKKEIDKEKSSQLIKFLETFNSLFNSSFQPTPGRAEKLRLRLKTYTFDQLLISVKNLSLSDFHRGKNDRNWKASPDFILKNDEVVDNWLNSRKEQKRVFLSDLIPNE